MSWPISRCGPIRDYAGRVVLILPHFNSWRLVGPDFDHLSNPCQVVLGSSYDADPADFSQKEWVASVYTADGRHIAALIHEEYHGTLRGTCVPSEPTSCWYNAVTSAVSRDGGRSFEQPSPPGQLVAAPSSRYRPGVQPSGVFSPSNIVRNAQDGLYYAMVASRTPTGGAGTCLIRTTDPFSPSSWRAWDGSGFNLAFVDPYRTQGISQPCTPVATPEIATMVDSLTYNTYLKRYLLVGMASSPQPGTGHLVTGFYMSVSSDLIHWSPRRLIMPATSVQTFRCGGPNPVAYPSLIDPSSRSPSFETTGQRPYLYYTRFNYQGCRQTLDRDLMRVPIGLSS